MTKRRALYITTRLFWPADSGRKVSLYQYCRGMSEQLGYEVHLFSFLESDQTREMASERPGFIESVEVAQTIPVAERVASVARAALDKSMPLQSCLYVSEKNARAIRSAATKIGAEVVIIDMVRLAPYADALAGLECAIVQNFDDLLSKRYLRQVNATDGNILGKYADSLPGFVSGLANGPIRDTVLRKEAKRLELAENRYGSSADAVLLVSPLETRELSGRIGGEKCFCATMGCRVADGAVRSSGQMYDFGFVGNMYTSANQASLQFIADELLPKLPQRSLRVIGVCPEEVIKSYCHNPAISFTGCVESISEHLSQCRLLLAPFVYGTGIKTKIIEAMGAGVPVVTNSIGLEGIAARPGIEVMCSDTVDGLADIALRLLENEGERERMAEAGRKFVESNHSWKNSINELGKCLDYAVYSSRTRMGRGCL